MNKKCLIIQPIILTIELSFFLSYQKVSKTKFILVYDQKSKKLFKNDKSANILQSINISWINLGPLIFNPQYIFIFIKI